MGKRAHFASVGGGKSAIFCGRVVLMIYCGGCVEDVCGLEGLFGGKYRSVGWKLAKEKFVHSFIGGFEWLSHHQLPTERND